MADHGSNQHPGTPTANAGASFRLHTQEMNQKRIPISTIIIAIIVGVLVFQTNLSALDDTSSLECDGGIVSSGDSEDSVRDKCGDPQKVTQEDADSPIIWFYNFGPSEFVYYVTFTNGIVERIQVGGYGD